MFTLPLITGTDYMIIIVGGEGEQWRVELYKDVI